jgi:hypothetical protein
MRVPLNIAGHSCACGARRDPGKSLCRKCRARARWARRRRNGARFYAYWLF